MLDILDGGKPEPNGQRRLMVRHWGALLWFGRWSLVVGSLVVGRWFEVGGVARLLNCIELLLYKILGSDGMVAQTA